jgi:hypothetical protein
MQRAILLALSFVIASVGIDAQSGIQVPPTVTAPPSGQTQWTTRTLSPAEVQRLLSIAGRGGGSCPVSLSASQLGSPMNREVGNEPSAGKSREATQLVRLTVQPRDARRIVSATVTVHGYANKGRVVETLTAEAEDAYGGGDAVKTLEVSFPSRTGSQTWAELAVPGFSAVSSVQVKSITYADGSSWKFAEGVACSTRIDPMMLVSRH